MGETWDTIFRDTTRLWVEFVFVPIVVVIGVLGNSLTIYILTRKKTRLSSEVYLTALTMSDLLFLLFFFSMSWKHYECIKSVKLYWNYIPFGLWFTDASSSTSVWLTVAFTIERYVAICHPLLTKSYSSNTQLRAALVATCVYFSCFLLTTPTSFEWHVVAIDSITTNGLNHTVFGLADLGNGTWYRLVYRWFSAVIFVLLPFLILAVGNVLLINAVRQSHKVRQNLVSCYVHRHQAKRMRQEDRVTINLISIIIIFLICQLPTTAILIYTSMNTPPKDSVEENVLLGLGNIFNLLVAINAECNFVLYTATSEKYRKSFFQIFWMDSVFQRLSSRKHRTIILKKPPIVKVDKANFRKPSHTKIVEQGSNETTECHKLYGLQRRKTLVTMRKCTTCEIIRACPTSLSSDSLGPTSL